MTTFDELEPEHRGMRGRAWDVLDVQRRALDGVARPDWEATIAAWLVHAQPRQHPVWDWYGLSAVHLRPIDCVTLPFKMFPAATHEILVVAIDPTYSPPAPGPIHYLSPSNIVFQLACTRDDVVAELANLAARACTHGLLPLEGLGQQSLSEWWSGAFKHTLAHLLNDGNCHEH